MGSESRPAEDHVAVEIAQLPIDRQASFDERSIRGADFFALVSQIERRVAPQSRVGETQANQENIRFHHAATLAFSGSDVLSMKVSESERIHHIATTFLGLTGSCSPLPLHMVEEVLHDSLDGGAMSPFLDVFHHRLISLLYRLVNRYRMADELRADGQDLWSARLFALGGGECLDPSLERSALLGLMPIFGSKSRSAESLRAALEYLLEDVLDTRGVHIVQCSGDYIGLSTDQVTRLGTQNSRLGLSTVLGERVRCRDASVTVRLFLARYDDCERFLDGGDLSEQVSKLMSYFVRDLLDWKLELVFRDSSVPKCSLGGSKTRLGLGTWLGNNADSGVSSSKATERTINISGGS